MFITLPNFSTVKSFYISFYVDILLHPFPVSFAAPILSPSSLFPTYSLHYSSLVLFLSSYLSRILRCPFPLLSLIFFIFPVLLFLFPNQIYKNKRCTFSCNLLSVFSLSSCPFLPTPSIYFLIDVFSLLCLSAVSIVLSPSPLLALYFFSEKFLLGRTNERMELDLLSTLISQSDRRFLSGYWVWE